MSLHGEGIINRLSLNSELRNPDNPMHKIINNGLGELLDSIDFSVLFEGLFVESATGKYLDLHGKDYNIRRNDGESDEHYRKRIIYESLGRLTVDYLREVYDLQLYTYVEDYDPANNQLTSDNQYRGYDGFMTIADDEIKNILNKKFVLNEALEWLII